MVDVAIVGGGYTGLSAAAVTARAGRSTVVLEAEHLGFGCSARNGGQAATSLKPNFDRLAGRFGESRARAILQEGIDALEGLRGLVADTGLDCDWQPVGRFCAAHSERQFTQLAHFAVKQAREFDLPAVVLSKAQQHSVISTERYHGGVLYPRHAAVHPAKLLRLLFDRAVQAGADFVSACPVLGIDREHDRFEIRTALGPVVARDVIIATNGYTGRFSPWHRRRVIPIRSNVIATEPLRRSLIDALLPSRCNIVDTRKLMVYYRPSPDGTRIIFGGRASVFDLPAGIAGPRLLNWLRDIFPSLSATRISHAWSGVVAYTFDELPHIGKHEGVHYCMGYCGSGMTLSIHFGRKVGLQVLGSKTGDTPLDGIPFTTRPFYHGFPWFLAPSMMAFRMLDAFNL